MKYAIMFALLLASCGDNIKPAQVDAGFADDATCPIPPADEMPNPTEECHWECKLEKHHRHTYFRDEKRKKCGYEWKCVEVCSTSL